MFLNDIARFKSLGYKNAQSFPQLRRVIGKKVRAMSVEITRKLTRDLILSNTNRVCISQFGRMAAAAAAAAAAHLRQKRARRLECCSSCLVLFEFARVRSRKGRTNSTCVAGNLAAAMVVFGAPPGE